MTTWLAIGGALTAASADGHGRLEVRPPSVVAPMQLEFHRSQGKASVWVSGPRTEGSLPGPVQAGWQADHDFVPSLSSSMSYFTGHLLRFTVFGSMMACQQQVSQ